MRVLPPDMPKKQADAQFALISRTRELQRAAAAKRSPPKVEPPKPTAPVYDDELLFPPGSKLREEMIRTGRLKPRNPPPSLGMRLFDDVGGWLLNTPPTKLLVDVVFALFFGCIAVMLIGRWIGI